MKASELEGQFDITGIAISKGNKSTARTSPPLLVTGYEVVNHINVMKTMIEKLKTSVQQLEVVLDGIDDQPNESDIDQAVQSHFRQERTMNVKIDRLINDSLILDEQHQSNDLYYIPLEGTIVTIEYSNGDEVQISHVEQTEVYNGKGMNAPTVVTAEEDPSFIEAATYEKPGVKFHVYTMTKSIG